MRGRTSADGWVLFDLDGTLLDYAAAERAAVLATLTDAGLPATEEVLAGYREVNARHWRQLERGRTTAERLRRERWQELLAAHGVEEGVDVELLAERYLGHLATGTQVADGAVEVVARIARVRRIAFLTNGLADVQRPRLEGSALAGTAEVVIVSDEVGAAKPDPAIFDAAFARMGGPELDDVVLVGDSLTADIAGGAAYGVETVWLAPPDAPDPDHPRPSHRIAELGELPPLLGA